MHTETSTGWADIPVWQKWGRLLICREKGRLATCPTTPSKHSRCGMWSPTDRGPGMGQKVPGRTGRWPADSERGGPRTEVRGHTAEAAGDNPHSGRG